MNVVVASLVLLIRYPRVCLVLHNINNLMFPSLVCFIIVSFLLPVLSFILLSTTVLRFSIAMCVLHLILNLSCGCSCVYILIDEFTAETEVLIRNIVLVESIHVGEVFFTRLSPM